MFVDDMNSIVYSLFITAIGVYAQTRDTPQNDRKKHWDFSTDI